MQNRRFSICFDCDEYLWLERVSGGRTAVLESFLDDIIEEDFIECKMKDMPPHRGIPFKNDRCRVRIKLSDQNVSDLRAWSKQHGLSKNDVRRGIVTEVFEESLFKLFKG